MEPWRRNLSVVFAANLLASVGMMGFLPSFPSIVRALGVTGDAAVKVWSGLLLAGAPVMAAFLGPVWGAIGDRFGRKAMVLRALAGITLFTGAMSLVQRPWQLLLLRLGQGVLSGYIPPSLTLVSVGAPADRQGRLAGTLQSAAFGGAIGGPLLGGLVLDHFGFRAVFLACSGLALVAFLLVVAFAVEVDPPSNVRHAPPGGSSVREALGAALRDLRATAADPRLRSLLVALFSVRFGAAMVEPVLQLVVERMEGVDVRYLSTITGTAFTAHALANFLSLPAWGRWGDRAGAERVLRLASLCTGIAFLPQALAPSWPLLAALRFVSGLFYAGILASAYGLAAAATGAERRGAAFGLVFSSLVFAGAVAPIAGGCLAAVLDVRLLFPIGGGLMILAALARRRR
ncbi:MAG TPA: MFS transporter [Planctomycetota bacterium]|jgi:DHA1 family multidrug resistance protein-like MFS transporter|nr:MFS transporter [Planctomycetota bacterium]